MAEFWAFREENFGPFLKYVKDNQVTDINYNGRDIWIDHLAKGRFKVDLEVTEDFVHQFSARLANAVSASFNKSNNLLEAETKTLRISILHESAANTGMSISIRKTEAVRRLNREMIMQTNYCSRETMMFLANCVRSHMNIIMCGLPGSGKTELLKYLTQYIPDHERVITIEDNLEIHYADINPQKDSVELKVHEKFFDYTKAIKSCLRQNPKWIMLSEARSIEVKYLLEAMSTGTHCLTTLHTDDVRKVPDRMQNMMKDFVAAQRMENDIYSFVDVGVLLQKRMNDQGGVRRTIAQVCVYHRNEIEKGNEIVMVMEEGEVINRALPANIRKKFIQNNVEEPFYWKQEDEKWGK